MTVREAVRRADELRPNALGEESKLLWLAQLDGIVRCEVLGQHEPAGADDSTADDTVLLVPEPYSGLYLYWLMAQIDLTLGEMTRYANDMVLYNSTLNAFAARYKAEHRPRLRGQFWL